MLGDGTLAGYIEELSVTGLTSNPTIFDKAISGGDAYDAQIAELAEKLDDPEEIFFQLALADLRDATDLFKGVHERTAGVDGFCSLEVSPKLADDTEGTIEQAAKLHGEADRENLFIKIPGTPAGLPAIEQSIFAGHPGQRHAAVLARAPPGRRRRLHEGDRTADRGRARPLRRLGRLDLHEPLGRRRRRRSPRRAARQARPRDRLPRLRGLPRAARLRPHAAADERRARGRSGCSGRAPGPRTRRPPTPSTSRASPRRSRSTRCPRTPCTPSPTTASSATRCPPTAATASRRWPRFGAAGIDVEALAERLQEEGKQKFVDSWEELLKTISAQLGARA